MRNFGFEVVSAKPKKAVADPPTREPMRANGTDKVRRQPSSDQKRVRRQLSKSASTPISAHKWASVVHTAATSSEVYTALVNQGISQETINDVLDFVGESPTQTGLMSALERQGVSQETINDVLDDVFPIESEASLNHKWASVAAHTAMREGHATGHSDDYQITAVFERQGNQLNVDVAYPLGFSTLNFDGPDKAAAWVGSFDIDTRKETPMADAGQMHAARRAIVRGNTEAAKLAGDQRMCEQHCGRPATVYAMGPYAGDWGGYYCEECAAALNFQITDRLAAKTAAWGDAIEDLQAAVAEAEAYAKKVANDPLLRSDAQRSVGYWRGRLRKLQEQQKRAPKTAARTKWITDDTNDVGPNCPGCGSGNVDVPRNDPQGSRNELVCSNCGAIFDAAEGVSQEEAQRLLRERGGPSFRFGKTAAAPTLPKGWRVELLGLINTVKFEHPSGRSIMWTDGQWKTGWPNGMYTDAPGIPRSSTMQEARKNGSAWLTDIEAQMAEDDAGETTASKMASKTAAVTWDAAKNSMFDNYGAIINGYPCSVIQWGMNNSPPAPYNWSVGSGTQSGPDLTTGFSNTADAAKVAVEDYVLGLPPGPLPAGTKSYYANRNVHERSYTVGMTTTSASPLDGQRGHKLMTAPDRRKLPKLYAQDGKGDEAVAYVKFFSPYSNYRLYVTEFDGEDIMFGYVTGMDSDELGYSSLAELEGANKNGLPLIERDRYWTPATLGQIKSGGRYAAKTAVVSSDWIAQDGGQLLLQGENGDYAWVVRAPGGSDWSIHNSAGSQVASGQSATSVDAQAMAEYVLARRASGDGRWDNSGGAWYTNPSGMTASKTAAVVINRTPWDGLTYDPDAPDSERGRRSVWTVDVLGKGNGNMLLTLNYNWPNYTVTADPYPGGVVASGQTSSMMVVEDAALQFLKTVTPEWWQAQKATAMERYAQ